MKINKIILSLLALLLMQSVFSQTFNGFALYNNQNSNTAYLIDKDGMIAHSWSCDLAANYTVLLKENGNIMRGGVKSNNSLNGPAASGIIQEIDPNGDVVWEFVYSSSAHCSHHDIALMSNGNVLLTAWEVKSGSEMIQAGWSGQYSEKWPTHFVEVQQNGTGGEIVWEWHMWDHMIQDHDASKDNYGVVEDHPELMDINAVSSNDKPGGDNDWYHVNGVNYNEALDQIVFTSRNASELFILDHSTTIEESASHSGGNAGMGGDFLYRWGNPANYGSNGTQTIPAAVHDPQWIKEGRPNSGYLQFFNNKGGGSNQSTVDAINPPLDGFNYTLDGSSFLPLSYDWRHSCLAFSDGQSAHDRMSNGNTFVCVSGKYMYEVDSLDNTVWMYNADPAKAARYECDYPGIIQLLGDDPCGTVGVENFTENNVSISPNPSTGIFTISGIPSEVSSYIVTIFDIYGNRILEERDAQRINLSHYQNGVYMVYILADNNEIIVKKLLLAK